MSRTKSSSFDEQRSLIQDRAAELFARQGFHNASMAELAGACEMSKPLLYHYYKDKEAILFDVSNNYIDELVKITQSPETKFPPGEERIRALISEFMKEYEHSQSRHIVLIQDVKFLGDERRGVVIAKQKKVVDAFSESILVICPELAHLNLEKPVTMILFGMMNWTFTWLRADGPLSYEQLGQLATEIFIPGVRSLAKKAKGGSQLTESLFAVI